MPYPFRFRAGRRKPHFLDRKPCAQEKGPKSYSNFAKCSVHPKDVVQATLPAEQNRAQQQRGADYRTNHRCLVSSRHFNLASRRAAIATRTAACVELLADWVGAAECRIRASPPDIWERKEQARIQFYVMHPRGRARFALSTERMRQSQAHSSREIESAARIHGQKPKRPATHVYIMTLPS